MKFRLIEEKENKKTLDLDEALGLKEDKSGERVANQLRNPDPFVQNMAIAFKKGNKEIFDKIESGEKTIEEVVDEVSKQSNFLTKDMWDTVIRTAMFSYADNESLKESRPRTRKEIVVLQGNYGYGWDDLIEYELTGDVDKDAEIYKEIRQDKKDYAENEPQYSHRTIHRFEKIEKVEEALHGKDEVVDFFDKAKRLGVENLGQLKDLLNQEESKGNTEKAKIDAYADVVELGNDTLSNESLKEYYDPTEIITDHFDEYEQKNYGIDEEGYTEDGLEQYVHCGWCEEPTPLSEMRKEVDLGYICKDCQDALYSRGEKAVYEEALDEKLIQGKSDATLKKNIATEVKAGKDPKQAYAIAKSVQKKNESFEDEHLGEVVKDDKIVDYFDNSVHDEDIVEDDFNMSDEDIKKFSEIAVIESKKNTKEVGNILTENKVDTTPTQEIINESINSSEEVALDYVSPNAVDANFQTQEVDLNNI